jgi:VanZ family protein
MIIDLRNRKAILWWGLVVVWMTCIFILSHQPAEQSNELSKGVTQVIEETLKKMAPQAQLDWDNLNHIVRKNAHFFAYFILAILLQHALRTSGLSGWRVFAWALSISVVYAISDELHQLFVPGRVAQVKDVLIDTAGALTGLILIMT